MQRNFLATNDSCRVGNMKQCLCLQAEVEKSSKKTNEAVTDGIPSEYEFGGPIGVSLIMLTLPAFVILINLCCDKVSEQNYLPCMCHVGICRKKFSLK